MKHIDINDAFHRMVKDGKPLDDDEKRKLVKQTWKKLAGALMDGDLELWCNGDPVALDYLNASVRFIIRDGDFIAWPSGAGMGWDPHAHTFTIDSEQFERLLARAPVGRPPKLTVNVLADEIAERRRTGRSTGRKILARHFDVGLSTLDRFRKKKSPK